MRADVDRGWERAYFYHKDDHAFAKMIERTDHHVSQWDLTEQNAHAELLIRIAWAVSGHALYYESIDVAQLKDGAFEQKLSALQKACPEFSGAVLTECTVRCSKSGKPVQLLGGNEFVQEASTASMFDEDGFRHGKRHLFWYAQGPRSWKALLSFLRS